jgi:hypothetical protein
MYLHAPGRSLVAAGTAVRTVSWVGGDRVDEPEKPSPDPIAALRRTSPVLSGWCRGLAMLAVTGTATALMAGGVWLMAWWLSVIPILPMGLTIVAGEDRASLVSGSAGVDDCAEASRRQLLDVPAWATSTRHGTNVVAVVPRFVPRAK